MATLVPIGEFSRMTYLTVKALRHYHDVGVLEPAEIDRSTGYRLYSTEQVPTALLVSRFRDLEMPLDEVREMLRADDLAARNRIILAHLDRMQERLANTQSTVESLKMLLETMTPVAVEFRWIEATPCLRIAEAVDADACEAWLTSAYDELERLVAVAGVAPAGPSGALYADEFFAESRGRVVAFIPIGIGHEFAMPPRFARATVDTLPAANFAVSVHAGSFADIDRTYGALGSYVAEHRLGTPGPVREHYVVASDRPGEQRTEICWPILPASPPPSTAHTSGAPT